MTTLSLLSRLNSGSMLLADRGYDADWIRAFASERGSWANVPPKCINPPRRKRTCASHTSPGSLQTFPQKSRQDAAHRHRADHNQAGGNAHASEIITFRRVYISDLRSHLIRFGGNICTKCAVSLGRELIKHAAITLLTRAR